MPENLLDTETLRNLVRDTLSWGLRAGPRILLVLIALLISLKLISVALRKLEAHLLKRNDDAEDASERNKRVQTLMGIVRIVVRIAAWTLFIMLLLVQVGIDIAPLLAGAGVLGLAVGFGAQELVRDTITGFFMLLEDHIREGDVAIINGTGGLVESIGLRTVKLRDQSGVVHVFQNGKVDTLSNMTKKWSAMVFDIGVAYKEDIDQVVEVMREVSEDLRSDEAFAPKILEPMEIFGVESFDDSAVVVRGRIKTKPIEQWNVAREYRRRLKYAFDAKGIEIPFPHRTLYWGEQTPQLRLLGQGAEGKGEAESA